MRRSTLLVRPRVHSAVAAACGVALVATAIGIAAPAAGAPTHAPTFAAAAPGATHAVTLITGDRVTVTDLPDGTHAVKVDTAIPGAGVQTFQAGGDLLVVPAAAEKYIASGVLDKDLFNVSKLIEDGYDDASVDAIPVIVERSSSAPSRLVSTTVPGLDLDLALPSISAAAGDLDHEAAAAAWSMLTTTTATARSTASATTLAGGIRAIHLDGKVHSTLDSSVPYIHAPEAWAEGYDGTGVTVAVLDTGYDDTHPDLQGRILEAKSFVPGQDADHDSFGHGTHVASTIAGTGAASGGTHRGVADGAKLLVGKVLSDEGSGQDSWIIAGMQWAAERAPIVSMSLGSQEPSDGLDVMSLALNQISESTGALFIVAAGNSTSPGTIGSPGAAADALTIGSVDDPSGALSWFSSQGPLFRSGALKPDLAGPGNDVTAARSSDSPGEGYYISMSGTSMATPHVAGAAAIVKQRHPEYSSAQLRAALTSTATDVGLTSYQAGSGVVNVKNAIDGPLIAAGSGDFGMVAWGEQAGVQARTIQYTNRSASDVTVDLVATLADTSDAGGGGVTPLSARTDESAQTESVVAPDGVLTMEADQLLIPAGETRSVMLTADTALVPAGHQLTGALVASIDGVAVARTALAAAAEDERYDLNLTATGFDGQPADTVAWISNGATGWYTAVEVSGALTLRLPPGTYSVMSFMDLMRTPDTDATVLVGDPDVVLDHASTVAFDARSAKKVTVDVGRKGLEEALRRMDYSADGFSGSSMLAVWVDELWAQPMTAPHAQSFQSVVRWRLWEPTLTVTAGRTALDVIPQVGSTLLDGALHARAVDVGAGSTAEFSAVDVAGKVAVVTRSDTVGPDARAANAAAAGAALLIVANDADPELSEWVGSPEGADAPIPVAAISGVQGRALLAQLARGSVTVKANGIPNSTVVYDIARYSKGSIPTDLTYTPRHLARIDTTIRGDKRPVGEYRWDFVPGQLYGTGYHMRASAGTQRTDWVNTDQLRWYQDVSLVAAGWEVRDVIRTFKPGDRTTADYFGAVVRPNVAPGYWAPHRTGSYAQVNLPSWSDGGDPLHTGAFDVFAGTNGAQQLTDVYIDGQLAASTPYQSAVVADVPNGKSTWRVVNTATHDGIYLASSTKTVTDWKFFSVGTSDTWMPQLLPMIQTFYRVDLGREGTVGAGRRSGTPVRIGLELSHVAGADGAAKITGATLEARIAGGKWTKVSTSKLKVGSTAGTADGIFPTGRGFVSTTTALVRVPNAGGWLDLRVTARDAAGNTVSQEITHALRVAAAAKHSHGCTRWI